MLRLSPITEPDVPRVAEFLHRHLNDRVSAADWARAISVPWKVAAPNHGYQLVTEPPAGPDDARGDIVGVYLAFYSEREVSGRRERFCNLGAWCVQPEHRTHSLRLIKALLAQDGYHFTDLSPSGNVLGLNTRLKFRHLDTTTALIPNLPWPTWPTWLGRRSRQRRGVTGDPSVIAATLTGRDLDIYHDHRGAAAARHVLLTRGPEWCHVIFRRDRRKGLPLFASLLHVSNPALFATMVRPFARHLLLRHGIPGTLAELRVVGRRPRPSYLLRSPRRKMFRSPSLEPDQIDYLYSELVCVAW